jgi:hypothetical protein
VAAEPPDPRARIHFTDALRNAGRVSESLGEYCEANRLNPVAAGYHNNYGNALRLLNRHTPIVPKFTKARRVGLRRKL